MNPTPRPWTAKDARECLALRKAGVAVKRLARQYGRAESCVRARLLRDGFRARPPQVEPWRGESVRDYAERLGLCLWAARRRYLRLRKRGRTPGCTKETRESLSAAARTRFRDEAAAMGRPEADCPREARLLDALEGRGWVSASAARRLSGLDRPAASRAVRRLAARGLVEARGCGKAREYRLAPALSERKGCA